MVQDRPASELAGCNIVNAGCGLIKATYVDTPESAETAEMPTRHFIREGSTNGFYSRLVDCSISRGVRQQHVSERLTGNSRDPGASE